MRTLLDLLELTAIVLTTWATIIGLPLAAFWALRQVL